MTSRPYPWRCDPEMDRCGYADGLNDQLKKSVQIAANAFVRISARLWDDGGEYVFSLLASEALKEGLPVPADFEMPSRVSALASRDGWECRYCAVPLGWGHPSVRCPEIDHVIPRCQGGSNRLENLVLSCGKCNRRKGGRTPEQWGEAPLRAISRPSGPGAA